ncbi:MAG: shikimate dehydrogenase family protein [Bacteroidia bacterium]
MRTYGLIGYPLTHSFSAKYFNGKFEREHITDAAFKLFPIESISELLPLIEKEKGLKGLSVTIPYKEQIIPFLDEMDPVAKKVGAVNCVRIDGNGKKTGFNTDVFGFRQSIKPFLEMHHEKALILGTGGASKAVHYVLKEIGIECFFATRSKSPDSPTRLLTYEELNVHAINAFKLIVNTTPLGMYPATDSRPAIPYEFLTPSHLLYDLVYNPAETRFLMEGKKHGAAVVNGLSMLMQQAEEAWRIWNL